MGDQREIHIASPVVGEAARELVAEVLASGRLAQGPMVERFEGLCADMAGVAHAVAVSSGTDALEVAIEALDLEANQVVVTSPFTFAATVNAVLRAGALVQFVDIDDDYLLDLDATAHASSELNVGAVVPVHLYGLPVDLAQLAHIAGDIPIVEDAAQAHGAASGDLVVGAVGAACFSFYATKNVMAGEGGVVTTDDGEWAAVMRTIRNQGMAGRYEYVRVGRNARMTELQAAIAIPQLESLADITDRRRRNARLLVEALKDLDDVVLPREPDDRTHVWHQCTVLVPDELDRGQVLAAMAEAGVFPGVYYPHALNDVPLYRDHPGVLPSQTPRARAAAARCLSLPIHHGLEAGDVERVAEAFRGAIARSR